MSVWGGHALLPVVGFKQLYQAKCNRRSAQAVFLGMLPWPSWRTAGVHTQTRIWTLTHIHGGYAIPVRTPGRTKLHAYLNHFYFFNLKGTLIWSNFSYCIFLKVKCIISKTEAEKHTHTHTPSHKRSTKSEFELSPPSKRLKMGGCVDSITGLKGNWLWSGVKRRASAVFTAWGLKDTFN